jgi:hypothetical protein
VPLLTRWTPGVAVDTGTGWLLHAGDGYFFHAETDPVRPHSTPFARVFQNIVQVDGPARRTNQARLRHLRATHGAEVEVFSAHCQVELSRYAPAADTA